MVSNMPIKNAAIAGGFFLKKQVNRLVRPQIQSITSVCFYLAMEADSYWQRERESTTAVLVGIINAQELIDAGPTLVRLLVSR